MDLTEHADLLAADPQLGAAAGMIARIVTAAYIGRSGDVERGKQRVDLALHAEEILMLTIGAEDQTLGLVGKVAALDRQIDAAHLIELDALVL